MFSSVTERFFMELNTRRIDTGVLSIINGMRYLKLGVSFLVVWIWLWTILVPFLKLLVSIFFIPADIIIYVIVDWPYNIWSFWMVWFNYCKRSSIDLYFFLANVRNCIVIQKISPFPNCLSFFFSIIILIPNNWGWHYGFFISTSSCCTAQFWVVHVLSYHLYPSPFGPALSLFQPSQKCILYLFMSALRGCLCTCLNQHRQHSWIICSVSLTFDCALIILLEIWSVRFLLAIHIKVCIMATGYM